MGIHCNHLIIVTSFYYFLTQYLSYLSYIILCFVCVCVYLHFTPSVYISVKFLREVTPYFRKASIISEVGWELQRAFLCPLGPGVSASPPAPKTTPRADTRYIPLQLTHLARNLKYIDPG